LLPLKIKERLLLLISVLKRKKKAPPLFPSFVSRSPFPSTDKVTGGFLWHYGAEFLAGMQLATGETHRDKGNAHHTMTGNRIPGQSPFI